MKIRDEDDVDCLENIIYLKHGVHQGWDVQTPVNALTQTEKLLNWN